jgi:TPR repeat protein
MRVLTFVLAAALVAACKTQAPLPDYGTLAASAAAGAPSDVAQMRDALLATDDLAGRLERLEELEAQALSIIEDEPLKLGSIGTAILDIWYGSLTGHYVLTRFYRHVESDAAEGHVEWLERIDAAMRADSDGTLELPYTAMTAMEARAYALSHDRQPLGALYQSNEAHPFVLLLQLREGSGPIENRYFALAGNETLIRRRGEGAAAGYSPLMMMGDLARNGDSAAQTSVGGFLAAQDRLDDATGWLEAAARSGNLAATSVLARVWWRRAQLAQSDEERDAAMGQVLENYLHAVALGSPDAMYALGVLYLNGDFGDENTETAIPLMQQAASLDHTDAMLYLGHLYYEGEAVGKDPDKASEYYLDAAARDNGQAQLAYARFMMLEPDRTGDPRAVGWLEGLAASDEPRAMVMLGNLYARGVLVEASPRRAVRWFKSAIKSAPTDPEIVNEVAWTLTVTDLEALREERYALKIMNEMMTTDSEANGRPEYLDTWAAAHAANGDFEGAVEKQALALSAATADDRDDVLEILETHMDLFKAGKVVIETVP